MSHGHYLVVTISSALLWTCEPTDLSAAPDSQAPNVGSADCELGALACACTAEGDCDLGLECVMGNCACPVGSPWCPCTESGECDPGLRCASGLCVDTGNDHNARLECIPGADQCPDDEKCMPYAKKDGGGGVDSAQCVALLGDKERGQPCTRGRYQDDCARDLLCMGEQSGDVGSGPEFVCYALCDVRPYRREASCTELGVLDAACNPYNEGALPWCDISCHPLRPTACADDHGCYPYFDGHWCFLPYLQDGASGLGGEACDKWLIQSCAPGFYCNYDTPELIDGCADPACCASYCDLEGDGSDCAPTSQCLPMWSANAATWDPEYPSEVGHCVVGAVSRAGAD